jgi:hypothetical protein
MGFGLRMACGDNVYLDANQIEHTTPIVELCASAGQLIFI